MAFVAQEPETNAEPVGTKAQSQSQSPQRKTRSWVLPTAIGGGAAVLLLIVVAVAALIKGATDESTAAKNSGADKKDNANVSAPSLTPARGETVNLLELVEPSRHVFSGGWTFDGEALVSAGGQTYDGLSVPYEPPAEYDVAMICERRRGNAGMIMKLVADSHDCNAMIDGWPTMGGFTGIHGLDGRDLPESEVVSRGMQLTNGKPAEIVFKVRKSRLLVQIDGRTVIDWDADYTRCAATPLGQRNFAIVVNQNNVFAITKLELKPVVQASK